jgi:nucleoside-diphosphate-sugar epimerase
MRVLVTGANGFIGSSLCPALINRGFEVVGLAMPGEDAADNEAIGVTTVRGDLTHAGSIQGVCDDIDLVYHLAGRVTDWGPRKAFYSSIVDATRNLLDEAAAGNVKRFVYASSVCAFGMGKNLKGKTECDPVFRSGVPYADAKWDAERLCRARARQTGLEVTIIRPTNVTGPGSVWVSDIVERFIESKVPLFDHGRYSASLVYIRNLVDGLLAAGTMEVAAGQTYQFRDDWDVTWRQYMEDLGALVGKRPFVSVPFALMWPVALALEKVMTPLGIRPIATRHTVGIIGRDLDIDNSKAKAELGWSTRVSYAEAIKEIAGWVRERYPAECT